MLVGHAWQNIFMACSKFQTMAIYVVKQACGNEIMPSVYYLPGVNQTHLILGHLAIN